MIEEICDVGFQEGYAIQAWSSSFSRSVVRTPKEK